VLTDCNREITSKYVSEDPLEFGKRYGVIQNPNVKVLQTRALFRMLLTCASEENRP